MCNHILIRVWYSAQGQTSILDILSIVESTATQGILQHFLLRIFCITDHINSLQELSLHYETIDKVVHRQTFNKSCIRHLQFIREVFDNFDTNL